MMEGIRLLKIPYLKNSNEAVNMFSGYIVWMVVALAVTPYIGSGSAAVFWTANVLGFIFFLGKFFLIIDIRAILYSVLYICVSLTTVVLNSHMIELSVESIGTNVNIMIVPLYIILCLYFSNHKVFSERDINNLLHCISVVGMVVIAVAWATGFNDIVSVIQGKLGAYQTAAAGVLHGKNIYGMFIGLTLCADIYLYKNSAHPNERSKRLWICLFKYIAVIVSFSRTALLQTTIAIAIYFFLERKRYKRDYMIFLLLGVVFLVLLSTEGFRHFFLHQVIRVDTGDAGRAFFISEAVDKVMGDTKTLIFGIGYSGIVLYDIDVDNTYYYVLFSGGVIKGIIYCVLVVYGMIAIRRLKYKSTRIYNISKSVFISYFFFCAFESVAIFEIGLLNFIFMIFMYIIPLGYSAKKLDLSNNKQYCSRELGEFDNGNICVESSHR